MIHRNFDNISKASLVEEIQSCRDTIGKSKYRIRISDGVVIQIDHDSRVVTDHTRYTSNKSMHSLKMEDLIIILRYLQNMLKCKEIAMSETKFGQIYDFHKNKWKNFPINPVEVKNKIKDYLKVKKNLATIGAKTPINLTTLGQEIKRKLLKIKENYKNNITSLCYDTQEKKFVIIINSNKDDYYDEMLKFAEEIMKTYKVDCRVMTFLDYVANIKDKKMLRLINY